MRLDNMWGGKTVWKALWLFILIGHLFAGFYYCWHTRVFENWYEREKCHRSLAVGYQFLEACTTADHFNHRRAYDEIMRGLLRTISEDRYACYYPMREEQAMLYDLRGYELGFGFKVQQTEKGAIISFVEQDSPAATSGVQCGDLILSIDGEVPKNLDALLKKVQEQRQICLELQRDRERFSVTLEAQYLTKIPLFWDMLDDQILYVALQDFSAAATRGLTDVLQFNEATMKGLILDLRGNCGGLMSEAIGVSSLFLKASQKIAGIRYHNGEREDLQTATASYRCDKPLVILINEETASASELTAAALQAYHRAILVGTKSYGKGAIQELCRLPYGGMVRATMALYETPKGVCFEQIGVTPDVVCPIPEESVKKIAELKKNSSVSMKDILEYDCQLGEAIKLIQTEIYKK